MQSDLIYWRARFEDIDTRCPVVRWTVTNAGSVLLGCKSGELLTLDGSQFRGNTRAFEAVRNLARGWGLSAKVLQHDADRLKFVIYDADQVTQDLAVVPRRALRKLALSKHRQADAFFDEIARRWSASGSIPHEIGFGLGYPTKDVLGYLGLSDLEHTGECGWRVFGDPVPSYARSSQFAKANALAIACLA